MAKNSGPVRTVHARTTGKERDEMIATTKAEICLLYTSRCV